MASSITSVTAAKAIGDCTAYLLNGQYKFIAEGMTVADEVYIFEESGTEGSYQKARDLNGNLIRLDKRHPSVVFTAGGNYKFLLGPNTNASLVVGYAAV
jgi:hypothetical protein